MLTKTQFKKQSDQLQWSRKYTRYIRERRVMKTSISMCFEKVLRKEKKLISSLTTEGTMSSYKQHIGTTYTSQQLSSGIIKYYNLNILI